ncbi:hypothetical protein PF001_g26472 [Phytophthora fragariae]|uniref:Uncharacterized protein n=1 Tax=Phytophthora fragariae TaxID=53985 RepID=A0A6A3R1E8_9STRA|nr:hypothetical protein PF006_g25872 [Phytophthora fragariae]KAE9275685.1 hypothetical protein PF001_g26472 [Phytophthora fragariae]
MPILVAPALVEHELRHARGEDILVQPLAKRRADIGRRYGLGQGGLRRARTRRPGQLRGPPSFHLFTGQPKDECINNAIYLYVPYLDEIEKILAAVPDELMYSKPTFKRVNRGAETMREYPQSKWHELFDTAKYDHLRMATGTDTACTSKHI